MSISQFNYRFGRNANSEQFHPAEVGELEEGLVNEAQCRRLIATSPGK